MKVIYNKYLPAKGYIAINILGIVILARKEKEPLSDKMINHEAIHTAQMKELIFLFFLVWYYAEWIVRIIQYRDIKKAYYNISFEREAYANSDNLLYLETRKLFSFLSCIKQ
jgi:hypothetical protein